jgi:hypothetical protein
MENYGTVNLGMSILEGKQRPDPKNQTVSLEPKSKNYSVKPEKPDVEIKKENVYMGVLDPKLVNDTDNISIHENIKKFLAQGMKKREAVKKARELAYGKHGDIGTITPQDIYRQKYAGRENQACTNAKYQEQEMPYI